MKPYSIAIYPDVLLKPCNEQCKRQPIKPCQCNEQETKRNFGHGPGDFTSSTHWETKARFPYTNLPFQMKNAVFRDMTLCRSEDKYDCFGATCCLYHQCKRHLKQAFPNVQDIYNKNQYTSNF